MAGNQDSRSGGKGSQSQSKAQSPARPMTTTQKKLSAIVIDILFGTMVMYVVYLYCGFRFPYIQAHQWFGVDEEAGVGHIFHTMFAMILAVVSREISQPVAEMCETTFKHITTKVAWGQGASAGAGGKQE